MSRISQLRSRLPLKAIIPILLISTLSIVSFASDMTVTSDTYKAVSGATFSVSGDYTVESLGFQVAPQAYTSLSTWSSLEPLTTTSGVEAGHWMYVFKLIKGESATLPIDVSVMWSKGGNDYEPMGETIHVTGALGNHVEQTFVYDVGDSFDSPIAILVTVE